MKRKTRDGLEKYLRDKLKLAIKALPVGEDGVVAKGFEEIKTLVSMINEMDEEGWSYPVGCPEHVADVSHRGLEELKDAVACTMGIYIADDKQRAEIANAQLKIVQAHTALLTIIDKFVK